MPRHITVVQPPAVDNIYPTEPPLPELAAALLEGFGLRPGANKGTGKEAYDQYVVDFAKDKPELAALAPVLADAALPMHEKAFAVKKAVLGEPARLAGGSAGQTMLAMVHSKLNGKTLAAGRYVSSIGDDEAGRVYRAAYDESVYTPRVVEGDTLEVDVIPFRKDRVNISVHTDKPCADYLKPEHFTPEDVKGANMVLYGGYNYYSKYWKENLEKLVELVQAEPETLRPLFVISLSSPHVASHADFQEAVKHAATQTRALINANVEEAGIFFGTEGHDKTLQAAEDFSKTHGTEFFITDGKNGSYVVKGGAATHYTTEEIPAERIRQMNGAGDAALGGYLLGRMLGLAESSNTRLAHQFAGAVIQRDESSVAPDTRKTFRSLGKEYALEGALSTIENTTENTRLLREIDQKIREVGA